MAHVAARHATRQMTKGELTQIGMLASPNATRGTATTPPVPMGQIAFQRANEREADFIAVQAMAAAGYDPAGLASYVMRVQALLDASARVFQPLPDREARASAIAAEIRKEPQRTYSSSEDFARVQALLKK
jgi:predicted Zn-dependent protease